MDERKLLDWVITLPKDATSAWTREKTLLIGLPSYTIIIDALGAAPRAIFDGPPRSLPPSTMRWLAEGPPLVAMFGSQAVCEALYREHQGIIP